ncbi:MAG TPA: alpha/beta hydrolase [Chryseolinea sp.]|nr:alpha/beta hydrolase [Chryseolinea sp.]
MKAVYIFSGLGADHRAFQFIDFSGFDITFIRWVEPAGKESIESYSRRLTEQIESTRPILIGLSFGGLIAIEVAKFIDTEKIILISSAKTWRGIPFFYRFPGRLKFHKILPARLLRKRNIFSNWFFGIKGARERELLSEILADTEPAFLKWAIDKIVTWRNTQVPENLRHIHGTADRILPVRYVEADIKVAGGGHFMIADKAKELSDLIRHEIGN